MQYLEKETDFLKKFRSRLFQSKSSQKLSKHQRIAIIHEPLTVAKQTNTVDPNIVWLCDAAGVFSIDPLRVQPVSIRYQKELIKMIVTIAINVNTNSTVIVKNKISLENEPILLLFATLLFTIRIAKLLKHGDCFRS